MFEEEREFSDNKDVSEEPVISVEELANTPAVSNNHSTVTDKWIEALWEGSFCVCVCVEGVWVCERKTVKLRDKERMKTDGEDCDGIPDVIVLKVGYRISIKNKHNLWFQAEPESPALL